MQAIERAIASITEDRRASYLFNTQIASDAVCCNPRKFGQEWSRRRDWLLRLAIAQPGEAAAEFAALIALAIEARTKAELDRPMRIVNHGGQT